MNLDIQFIWFRYQYKREIATINNTSYPVELEYFHKQDTDPKLNY